MIIEINVNEKKIVTKLSDDTITKEFYNRFNFEEIKDELRCELEDELEDALEDENIIDINTYEYRRKLISLLMEKNIVNTYVVEDDILIKNLTNWLHNNKI